MFSAKSWSRASFLAGLSGLGLIALMALGCGPAARSRQPASAEAGHEKAINELFAAMDECNATLSSVDDRAGAAAAAPRVEGLIRRMSELSTDLDALGEPSESMAKRIETKYLPELNERAAKFNTETARVDMLSITRGGGMKSNETDQGALDKAKEAYEAWLEKQRRKWEVRRGSGGGAVRG